MMRQRQWIAVARRTSHVNTKLRRPCFASAAQRLSNESVISKQRHKILTLRKRILNVLGQQAWLITVVDFNILETGAARDGTRDISLRYFCRFRPHKNWRENLTNQQSDCLLSSLFHLRWKRRKHGGRSPIQSWICQVKSFFLQALQG